MRDAEKTIGTMIDRQKVCFIGSVDADGFPNVKAMGKAAASTLISLTRELIFGVGFALLLPMFWGLDGLLVSFPLSDFLTFIIAAVIIRRTYKELSE